MTRIEAMNAFKIEYIDYSILLHTAQIVFSNKQNQCIFVY